MRKRKSSAAPTVESSAVESPVAKDEEGQASAEGPDEELPTVAADDATGSYGSDEVADAPLEGGDGGDGGDDIFAGEETGPAGDDGVVAAAVETVVGVAAEAGDDEGDAAASAEAGGDEASDLPDELPPGVEDEAALPTDETRLQSIVESLLFASDRALGVADLKRLLGERDGQRITAALEAIRERRADTGIQLVSVAGGWQLRTHPANGAWVAKLVAGRPQRLSRAMMETLAIVAYRQPITRPEIDEIRGVDCGPVLRTLLDRSLVRVIGKKEEVGRPMLYGTTPEFLKTFSLRDLTELPTLRDFHELGAAERAEVDAATSARGQAGAPGDLDAPLDIGALRPSTVELPNVDPDEEEALLEELEQATQVAGRATAATVEPAPAGAEGGEAGVEAAGRPGTDAGER